MKNFLEWSVCILFLAFLSPSAGSQNFVKITDPNNPIFADPGSPNGSYTGASWIDFNGDGLQDLFVNRQSSLYRNFGEGMFERVLNAISNQGNTFGNTWSDFDNDGDIDCFVSGGSPFGSFLYRNDGGDLFTKITTGAIGDSITNSGWGSAWGDFDNDGFVDLIVAAPNGFAGISHENRLFLNNGDGTLSHVDTSIVETGLAPYTIPVWSDYDLDGDQDLFIGSGPAVGPTAPDFLYQNMSFETGIPYFERITTAPIATDLLDGQVWNWIDYDNDGNLDAFQTNYNAGLPNNLYRNTGGGTFERMTGTAVGSIVTDLANSLANLWGDFNNDGDLDCIVTNDGATRTWYYSNNGDGSFTRDDTMAIATGGGPHYGATAGDYDNDGDLDIFVSGTTATKGLYRNDLSGGNSWIEVRCVGDPVIVGSNGSGIGTRVRAKVLLNGTDTWLTREVSAQNSFDSQNMLDLHFGLGDATLVDSLIIRWPSGLIETIASLPTDVRYVATEGQGLIMVDAVETLKPIPDRFALHQNYPNPFNPSTMVRFDLDSRKEIALKVFDLLGREIATIAEGMFEAGSYSRTVDASSLSSGVYFYRLQGGPIAHTRRFVVLK